MNTAATWAAYSNLTVHKEDCIYVNSKIYCEIKHSSLPAISYESIVCMVIAIIISTAWVFLTQDKNKVIR